MSSYSEIIPISIDEVWENFIIKINHPEYFVPGVSNVIIKEKNDEYTIREMHLKDNINNINILLEHITYDPYWVKFTLVNHPIYTGYVENIAEVISDNETKITYRINWVNIKTQEPFDNNEIVKLAVQKTIDYIMNKK